MTVAEILTLITGDMGSRRQLTQANALRLLNQIQAIAFDKDIDAFIVSNSFVTITSGVKGPYSFPTSPRVRKFIGVSTQSQEVILKGKASSLSVDYGMVIEGNVPGNIYTPIIIDKFSKKFTFVGEPVETANTYRHVYYRGAPTILGATDDTKLLIPEEYHHTLCVQGTLALFDFSSLGVKTPRDALLPYLEPFWRSLMNSQEGDGECWRSQQ